ncbi:type IV pilin [Halorarius litoreus]|uniref:type IV pilin n=1 Tax=Halorarius litoreus TaxID=2962676 RepID=UPI0020CE0164|nr:type IV pilin N-terminal domain-containing protein [Halorarius litoreus]
MDFTQLKHLFTDEDAVSPVIGVILMVAITVILAAVIGTFVLGLGENVQDSAPQANFQFEYSGDFSTGSGVIDITHTGGEDIAKSTVSVQAGSDTVESSSLDDWGSTISTGSTETLSEGDELTDANVAAGNTVRVIWTSPSGGQSSTIGQSQIPN